ncbi:MAG: hypothetical protein COB15_02415 [Flavobacteriales bacterium]|nr:MAG: hypothetical protein COB15_02415 [Flavobacteriales bacterium]
MINKFLTLLLVLQTSILFSQDIPIGDWQDHLPYSDAVSVSYGEDLVYCATNSAVFTYNIKDGITERLNLVNGLSDIGLRKIKFNDYNKRVIIAYTNGNIDIIDENKNITNLSFIKNSNIIGSKSINHIYLVGKLAYLSTGFGIVVLDTDKSEIVDTYMFGPLGSFVITNAVTTDSLNIYAATNQGVFFANKYNSNLADYNNWSLLSDLGTGSYSSIVTFSNRLFASSNSSVWAADTLYYNDSGIWQKFLPDGTNINSLSISQNHLFINYYNKVNKYDVSLSITGLVTHHKSLFNISPFETVLDDEGYMLIAEESHGILRKKNSYDGDIITLNGPSTTNIFNMDFVDDELWTVSGGYGIKIDEKIINHQSKRTWSDLPLTFQNPQGNNLAKLVNIAINPQNTSNVYASSWQDGLLEFNNGNLTNIFNAQNSILDNLGSLTVTGPLNFDKDNNLWILNSFTENILAVKTPTNNWYNYSFPGFTNALDQYQDMIIDKNNYKWIINTQTKGIIVFDDNNTLSNKSDDLAVLLTGDTISINSDFPYYDANVPGTVIFAIEEDLDGEIWIGTDEGIAVFYNSSAVFDENIKAEQIYIQQDGQTQVLLETETVTVIAIDGANRKWIGTQNSGVYLMSEDGTEEVEHFTTENSPLFSNNIFDIEINPKTGEVFFGTEKGLISFKGTATEADTDFNNVFVYPNPVKPDFTGTIAIRGLVKDTDVRITDISGNIVYQTTSLGGQAIWDGKDFNGNKVHTGVYMIFNGSPNGDLKAVAKILFIH